MYYFFSYKPCALKINGEYKGQLSLNLLPLSLNGNELIELIPIGEFLPVAFTLQQPIKSIKILHSPVGDFIFPTTFTPQPQNYKRLFYQEFNGFIASVVTDGASKLILSNQTSKTIEPLPQNPNAVKLFYSDNRHIGLLFSMDKELLIIKEIPSGNNLFYKTADSISLNGNAVTCLSKTPSALKHTVFYHYEKNNCQRKITREISPSQIHSPSLFCFAFLEAVALKDELTDFLADGMPAQKIANFLGDFDYVFPISSSKYSFAIVGNNVKLVNFEIKNSLICDIITN